MSQDGGESAPPGEDQKEEESRRSFLKWAVGVGAALVITGIAAVTKSLWTPSVVTVAGQGGQTGGSIGVTKFPKVKVANLSDLGLNQTIFFDYPLVGESNMIVKLGQQAAGGVGPHGDIVAFSVICQHLGCIVGYQPPSTSPSCNSSYKASGPVGYCCCHASIYDLLNGAKVIGGPSPRPQPQVALQFDESTGDVYAVGMGPPTIFGHNTGSSDVTADLQGGTLVS